MGITFRLPYSRSCEPLHFVSFLVCRPDSQALNEDFKSLEDGRTPSWKEPGSPNDYMEQSPRYTLQLTVIPAIDNLLFW